MHAVVGLPAVTGLGADGDGNEVFESEAFPEMPGPEPVCNPLWHQGDRIQKTLEIERDAGRSALVAERERSAAEMEAFKAGVEKEKAELQAQLESVERQHANLIASLKSSSEEKEMSLSDQVQRLTLENVQLKEAVRQSQQSAQRMALDVVKQGVKDARDAVSSDLHKYLSKRAGEAKAIVATLVSRSRNHAASLNSRTRARVQTVPRRVSYALRLPVAHPPRRQC